MSHIQPSWADDLKVVVHESLIPQYQKLVEGRTAHDVTDFNGMPRDLVELTLLMQAFEHSDIEPAVRLVGVNAFERQKILLKSGTVLMAGNLWWLDEIDDLIDSAIPCVPLLKSGSTVWGIYGLETNPRLKKVKSVGDIAGLTAITDPSWHRDVAALNQLNANIVEITQWHLLKKMLVIGRADFTLLPFADSPDMSVTWEGVRVVPVKGIKIGIQGERGYVISKTYPNALSLHRKLNAELEKMLQQGTIASAFQQAGVINNPKVKHWQMVNIESKDKGKRNPTAEVKTNSHQKIWP